MLIAGGIIGVAMAGGGGGSPSSACIDAIEYADEVLVLSQRGFGYAGDAFSAAAEFDVDGINRASDDMNAAAEDIADVAPGYRGAKAECRAGE